MTLNEWIHGDKFLHLVTSLLIVLVLALYLPFWLSIAGAVALGVAKEFWDKSHEGVSSWKDALYDLIGILIGVGLYFLAKLC